MGWSDRVQRVLLTAGLCVAAVLLARFGWDLGSGVGKAVGLGFLTLAAGALLVLGANLSSSGKPGRTGPWATVSLLATIPVAFLAASLDCMGLTLAGCSRFCEFVKVGAIPALALGCLIYLAVRSRLILISLTAASFVPLIPHCVCYNAANGWWIDLIGASPLCYVWGMLASLVAISALATGRRAWLSLSVNVAIIGGALAFFVGHHFFRYPW